MLFNFELKAPSKIKLQKRYNHKLAVQIVIELIDKYDIGYKTIFSSFSRDVMETF